MLRPSADSAVHHYALSLGSNRALSRRRTPARLLDEAAWLIAREVRVLAVSQIIATPPLGPSLRNYANAALLIESLLTPPALLDRLQAIERALGRRRFRRWGARSIDIDIILWSGGSWRSRTLAIPHPALAQRAFVLTPLCAIVPTWRVPRHGRQIRHLDARLRKAKPIPATRG